MTDHWSESAACRTADPALFFPASKQASANGGGGYAKARVICGSCEVRGECLDAAMLEEVGQNGWRIGMRGGKSPSERDKLARGSRRCWICGDAFRSPGGRADRYCQREECRAEARRQRNKRYQDRVA